MLRFLLVVLALGLSAPSLAQTNAPNGGPLRIAVTERPPFAIRGEDGSWQGPSVNIWRTAAEELQLTYEFVDVPEEMLVAGVASGAYDVALPVYATPDAARRTELVPAHYTTTLGIAEMKGNRLIATVRNLASWQFLRIILYLSVLLLIVGAIVWLVERRRNDQFSDAPIKGLGDGFWWAGVTLTTIGYGDKAPQTATGRAVAMLWMLIGLGVSAALTAAVVSSMDMAAQSPGSAFENEDKSFGAIDGAGAQRYLEAQGFSPRTFPDIAAGLRAVKEGEIDAFVHPAPHLQQEVGGSDFRLRVTTTKAEPVGVTLALPEDSPLREDLEETVIRRITTEEWWTYVAKFIADGSSGTTGG